VARTQAADSTGVADLRRLDFTAMAIDVGFFLVTLVAPGVLAYLLRNTRARWLPAFALTAFGVYCFATLDTEPSSGLAEIANFIQAAYGVGMLVYAAILIVAAYVSTKMPRPQPPIPRAKLV
jgi:hypothetical protein